MSDSATPWTVAHLSHQVPLTVGFSRPEYWSGFPCPPPGDLPNPGIKPRSPISQADSLPSEPSGKPLNTGVGSLSLLQCIFLTQESNQSPAFLVDSLPAELPGTHSCPAMPAFSLSLNMACSDPPKPLALNEDPSHSYFSSSFNLVSDITVSERHSLTTPIKSCFWTTHQVTLCLYWFLLS